MRKVPAAKIPESEASETIPGLIKSGIADKTAKISKEKGFRLVPVLPERIDEISQKYEICETDSHTLERLTPQERILHRLSDLPVDIKEKLPTKWESVGEIIILKLDESCRGFKETIGKTYAEVLNADTVCADISGVSGEFRRPSMEVLYGNKTESVRSENGILYDFDVTRVMFASGNTDERMRMRTLDCTGETVVDMFAGIGYFTLPLAKFTGLRKIFSCEKNPESYGFLLKNIELNGLKDKVIPMLGDNRGIPGKKFADRILMGYVQTTSLFLPKALDLIKPGGIIHYHDTFPAGEHEKYVNNVFSSVCKDYEILEIREVKSFAPGISHYVADVKISDRFSRAAGR